MIELSCNTAFFLSVRLCEQGICTRSSLRAQATMSSSASGLPPNPLYLLVSVGQSSCPYRPAPNPLRFKPSKTCSGQIKIGGMSSLPSGSPSLWGTPTKNGALALGHTYSCTPIRPKALGKEAWPSRTSEHRVQGEKQCQLPEVETTDSFSSLSLSPLSSSSNGRILIGLSFHTTGDS